VVVLGLLALPVEYRGGAERPHAHATYQLWYDAAHGSVAHHHRWGATDVAGDHVAEARPVSAAVTEPDGADVPQLVGSTIGVVKVPLLVAAISLLVAPPAVRSRAVWPAAPTLIGRSPGTETPPPRPLAAFA
jgi:hypothetical protein